MSSWLADPERFRFARDTSFGRRHMQLWSNSPVLLWIVSTECGFFLKNFPL
jgi:mlo protein